MVGNRREHTSCFYFFSNLWIIIFEQFMVRPRLPKGLSFWAFVAILASIFSSTVKFITQKEKLFKRNEKKTESTTASLKKQILDQRIAFFFNIYRQYVDDINCLLLEFPVTPSTSESWLCKTTRNDTSSSIQNHEVFKFIIKVARCFAIAEAVASRKFQPTPRKVVDVSWTVHQQCCILTHNSPGAIH